MSNFQQLTRHPETKTMELADWIDDYYGKHQYGVRFPDGKTFPSHICLTVSQVEILGRIPSPLFIFEEGFARPIKYVKKVSGSWDKYLWDREWVFNDNVHEASVLRDYTNPENLTLRIDGSETKREKEHQEKVIRCCEEQKLFGPLEDGFVYFFPANKGALSATDLRIIADEIDHRNASWEAQLEEDLT